jgi:hypothetical protein
MIDKKLKQQQKSTIQLRIGKLEPAVFIYLCGPYNYGNGDRRSVV